MSIKERGGKWWVFGYVVDAKTGKRVRVRRSTGIDSTGQASRKLAEEREPEILRLAQLEASGLAAPEARTTLGDAFGRLVVKLELGNRSPKTLDIAFQKYTHLALFFGPGRQIGAIKADDLARYAEQARKTRAPGSVHRELRTLREAMRAAGVEPPPMPDLGRVYVPRERALPPEEQRALVGTMSSFRRRYVVMYLHLGLSLSEIRKFGAGDLRPESGQFGELRVRGTKAHSRDRWVPLTREARAAFDEAVAEAAPGADLFPEWGNINRDLKAACRRAGIEPATTNDLRRSFATEHAKRGTPIHVLKYLMGHTSTRMLDLVYARVGAGSHTHDSVHNLPTLDGDHGSGSDDTDDTDTDGSGSVSGSGSEGNP